MIPFTDIKILEPPEPVINTVAGLGDIQLDIIPAGVQSPFAINNTIVPISFYYEDKSIPDILTRIIGIGVNNKVNMTVKRGDTVLAILPPGTKFEKIVSHEYCLNRYSYGTEEWYSCEVERQ